MSTFEIVKVTTIIYDISKIINGNRLFSVFWKTQLLCTILK